TGMPAPYFVEWVRQQLDDRFGRKLYEQGLKVYTTLDLQMQSAAERSLEKQIRAIEGGRYGAFPHTSYARYMARNGDDEESARPNSPYLQGAFIAMDPTTGAVRALVGGRDFDDNKFNRAVQAVRQPGSTFKPIVYAAAVRQGRPLSYLLDDSPLTLALAGSAVWNPQNFDGLYEGPISLRQAFYQSRNIPAVRLGLELGTQSVIDEARKFGITTPIPSYPSIFIGAADVYPIEMVGAYTTFATLGTRAEPMAITRVEDQQGNVIWAPEPARIPVLQPDEAWLLVSAMKDVVQKGSAASTVGASFRYPAAGKTGTTNDGTDVWFIGFTSDLVAGVWMGFDRPQRIKANAQGGILAAPAWTMFMADVYKHRPPPPDWQMPSDILTEEIDVTTNKLPTPWCPRNVVGNERFIPGTDPVARCDIHTASFYPDSNGIMQPYPPGTTPVPTYPGVLPSPYPTPTPRAPVIPDTGRAIIVTPGSSGGLRPVEPYDTSRRPRPRAIFGVPPRDTSTPKITPPRDTPRRPSDTLSKRATDTLLKRPIDLIPRQPPDSIRIRPPR
ncbi:MAG TPA: penicillin-binding transpeptidase domain-containing protein, partial [Gemmatimonadaceae bacterium]